MIVALGVGGTGSSAGSGSVSCRRCGELASGRGRAGCAGSPG